jgi:hypothetical protein
MQSCPFSPPRLAPGARAHRAELYRAALVMLRAWLRSGLEPAELVGWAGPWASFNDWSRVVRGAIVFAGLADPIGAKATKAAETSAGASALIAGLREAIATCGSGGAVRAAVIHEALVDNDEDRRIDRLKA